MRILSKKRATVTATMVATSAGIRQSYGVMYTSGNCDSMAHVLPEAFCEDVLRRAVMPSNFFASQGDWFENGFVPIVGLDVSFAEHRADLIMSAHMLLHAALRSPALGCVGANVCYIGVTNEVKECCMGHQRRLLSKELLGMFVLASCVVSSRDAPIERSAEGLVRRGFEMACEDDGTMMRIENCPTADGHYPQKRSERVVGLRTLEAATPELHRIALERGTNVVAANQDIYAGSVS